MKKLFLISLIGILLSGCIEYQEKQNETVLDFADNFYEDDLIYNYYLIKENLYHYNVETEVNTGEFELYFEDLFKNYNKENVIEDLINLDENKIINNMYEHKNIKITQYGKDNARVYSDKNLKGIIILKDINDNIQIYNELGKVPALYSDFIKEMSSELIYCGHKTDSENTQKAILSFANTEMLIITGNSSRIIYSPDYSDMDIEYKNLPMKVDFYIQNDNIKKIVITTLNKENMSPEISNENLTQLKSLCEYGDALASIAEAACKNHNNASGNIIDMDWNYYYNVAYTGNFNLNILDCNPK